LIRKKRWWKRYLCWENLNIPDWTKTFGTSCRSWGKVATNASFSNWVSISKNYSNRTLKGCRDNRSINRCQLFPISWRSSSSKILAGWRTRPGSFNRSWVLKSWSTGQPLWCWKRVWNSSDWSLEVKESIPTSCHRSILLHSFSIQGNSMRPGSRTTSGEQSLKLCSAKWICKSSKHCFRESSIMFTGTRSYHFAWSSNCSLIVIIQGLRGTITIRKSRCLSIVLSFRQNFRWFSMSRSWRTYLS
jgi:hypothetical protein